MCTNMSLKGVIKPLSLATTTLEICQRVSLNNENPICQRCALNNENKCLGKIVPYHFNTLICTILLQVLRREALRPLVYNVWTNDQLERHDERHSQSTGEGASDWCMDDISTKISPRKLTLWLLPPPSLITHSCPILPWYWRLTVVLRWHYSQPSPTTSGRCWQPFMPRGLQHHWLLSPLARRYRQCLRKSPTGSDLMPTCLCTTKVYIHYTS